MEHYRSQERKAFKPISETLCNWGRELMLNQRANRETQSGVLGFGRSANDSEAVTVFVAPNTDTSDKEIYPDEVNGERVVFEHLSFPDEQ